MATTSKILPVFALRQEKPFLPSKILAHLETRIQLGHMLFIIHKFSAFWMRRTFLSRSDRHGRTADGPSYENYES